MNRRKLTRVLLESGCEPGVRNKQGETAEDIANRKNLTDIVQILRTTPPKRKKQQANPMADQNGKSVDDSDDIDAIRVAPVEEDEDEVAETFPTNWGNFRRNHSSGSSSRHHHRHQQSSSRERRRHQQQVSEDRPRVHGPDEMRNQTIVTNLAPA